jgi:phosphoribosylaminoimidazole-succinocarboxamide synthase
MSNIYKTEIPNYTCKRGKVREIYSLGETLLLIITTDRISAFDYVFPNTTIPDKGRVLQGLSLYWADLLNVNYHLISADLNQMPEDFRKPEFEGRAMLVEKAEVIPFECVVRGYLAGSAWKEYQQTGSVCDITLPKGLKENQQLIKPIFTPATKVDNGHDQNVTFDYMSTKIGLDLTAELEIMSLEIYKDAAEIAWNNGIIIADTKFEFGVMPHAGNTLILIDEILTPDSSRFWPLEDYRLDGPINSFDKQFVRNWVSQSGWDKNSEPPPLPEDVVMQTRDKYLEAYEKITGQSLCKSKN